MHVRPRTAALLVGCALLAWVILCTRLAWVAEDAFFTIRMAENLATGHGLVWNPRARVMVASCPLWVLLLAPVLAIVDKPYSVVVGISITTSVVMATVLVRRVAASPISAVLALVALGACQAVVEWSVSGMENPLAFLLLVVAVAAWRARR